LPSAYIKTLFAADVNSLRRIYFFIFERSTEMATLLGFDGMVKNGGGNIWHKEISIAPGSFSLSASTTFYNMGVTLSDEDIAEISKRNTFCAYLDGEATYTATGAGTLGLVRYSSDVYGIYNVNVFQGTDLSLIASSGIKRQAQYALTITLTQWLNDKTTIGSGAWNALDMLVASDTSTSGLHWPAERVRVPQLAVKGGGSGTLTITSSTLVLHLMAK
jgi:hypothetical protein